MDFPPDASVAVHKPDSPPEIATSSTLGQALFEHSGDAVLLIDPINDRVLAGNPAACRLFGCSEEKFRGVHPAVLIEQTAETVRPPPELTESGDQPGKTTCRSADGTRFRAAVNYVRLPDEGGRDLALVILRDVDLNACSHQLCQRMADQTPATAQFTPSTCAHSRERELLQAIVDNIPVMLCIHDPNVQTFQINRELTKVLGYTQSDMDVRFMERVYPDPAYRDEVIDYMKSLAPGWRDLRTTAKDGSVFSTSWANVRLSDDRQVGIGLDVRALRQAEHDLRESDQRFRLVASATNLGTFLRNMQTGENHWSPEFLAIFGLKPHEAPQLEHDIPKAVHPDDRERVLREAHEAFAAGGNFISEHRILRPDGSIRWVLTRSHITLSENGRPLSTHGFAMDITEQKRAEEALRRSEERARWLARFPEENPNPVLRVTRDGEVLYRNPGALRSPGWECVPGEILPEECIRSLANEALRTGNAEETVVQLGERHYAIAFTPVAAEDYVNIYARDITDQKRTQAVLQKSEARLRLLSHTAGRLLASDDPQSVIDTLCRDVMDHLDCDVFFNFMSDAESGRLRLNTCAGIAAEDAEQIRWLDYGVAICGCVARDRERIVIDHVQQSDDPRAALIQSLGIQAYCCHPLMAQARLMGTLSFGTRKLPAFSTDEVELMHTVANQVSTALQRVADQQALQRANERLREADRRKDEFLAVLSHELRNPLAPIKNSLYIMDHAAPGGDQARRAHSIASRQVDQLVRLVDDLLDVTRIARGKIRLQRQRLELDELMRGTIEDYRLVFDRARVRLRFEPSPAPLYVDGDWNRLAQVVGNLLQNAAKFSPADDCVTASVAADDSGRNAVIRISDRGVGMSMETLANLFTPFMQAEKTLDRSRGGLGLGLALVKGLVELHGGHVSASSAGLGEGSEFTVVLPLVSTLANAPAAAAQEKTRQRRRVLIIEDNIDAADSLRELLELCGQVVEVRYNGADGLACAREFLPEVVLCDIGLPEMDGYAVARAFRAEERLRDVLLVAVSGYALPEDLQRAQEAGFDRHMAKPTSIEKLEALLFPESGD